MGVVFKAKQVSVDRVVAIKILLDPLAQNKEFIKRFEREAMIAPSWRITTWSMPSMRARSTATTTS